MSGPWEDFAAPPEAAPDGLIRIHVERRDDDPANPATDFAEPDAPYPEDTMPTDGVDELPPAPEPTTELAPATNRDELMSGLQMLTDQSATSAAIRSYIEGSGYSVSPETNEWLDTRDAEDAAALDAGTVIGWEVPNTLKDSYSDEPVGTLGSAWSGVQSGALLGFDDEWQAGWGTAGNVLGTALGMNESTASIGEIYDAMLKERRAHKQRAWDENPIAYGAGYVPGMLLTAPLAATRGAQAETALGRMAQAARAGAGEGAASGMGNADGGMLDRINSAAQGAAVGGLLAPVAAPIADKVGGMLSSLASRVRPNRTNALNSGLDVLARAAPQDAEAMYARAGEMEAAGVPWRLLDVVDESGRGAIRSAASKMTPAREELARHADDVYVSAQDRVADQARKHVSSSPRTSRSVAADIAEQQTAMGPRFDAVRQQPVAVTPEMVQAFSTAEGRSTLRSIGRYMTPDERKDLDGFISAVNSVAKHVDPRLPPAIQEQITRQLMEGSPLTVDIADKFARIITERAKDTPALRRVAGDYADIVRGAARDQHPEYSAALDEFAARARVGNAAEGTRSFENTDFLRSQPEEFRNAVNAAGDVPYVAGGDGSPAPISEAQALRLRARDDVVDAATSGSGARAMATARQIANGTAQGRRNEALLGAEGADALQRGMQSELTRAKNTAFVDPRTGSQTASRMEDDMATELLGTAADIATNGKTGIIRAVAGWLKDGGIRGVDAERLTRDAMSEDPARNRTAIEYLVKRGVERERARSLVRSVAARAMGRMGGASMGTEREVAPPNSVRAIIKGN